MALETTHKKDKYNVNRKDKSKRTFSGIVFDSELEMRYYIDYILPRIGKTILKYELQHKYELQPAFTDSTGKRHREISYVSDFEIWEKTIDGSITHRTLDIKGFKKPLDQLKIKLLLYRYPSLNFELISYSKIDGGWQNLKTIEDNRKKRKKGKESKVTNEKKLKEKIIKKGRDA